MELTKLCRLCLIKCENQISYSIFCEETILKLNLCGGLIIEENINLPGQMCEVCFHSLENAHKFRIRCQSSEKRLLELTKINLKNELPTILCNIQEESLDLKINNSYYTEDQSIPEKLEIQNDLESESKLLKVKGAKRKYIRKKSKEKKLAVNEQFTCHICQVNYKAKNAYIYHMRRHRNEMDFICEICGTAFETNFKLSRHLLQHTGIKKYPCRTCEKSFPTSSNRDRHERRLHTTIRPFQCEYCIKVFAYSDQLKNHIRVHTGEKPFICEKCGTAFRRKSHLITHKKAITPCFLKNREINVKQRVREIKQVL